ncbi:MULTISPECIES: AAA family ATPase [Clostridia]|uniref:AAA family ATPase n=1 Tax=Clostridia TaxID=186801 RepID=UPI000EA0FC53|nr:AAA family ATPase [Roseburia sp. 1XD42-34]NBJ71024.1 chromosome segregation protein SMC [Roseburia sp. 1XD42-34]RKI75459.1 chromosome segregation protein SMC [Clostridium sp. 1xD42-85]
MIKINKLEIENVKRVKAVKIEPTANGLTIVGGKNRQGKTSVLDAIAWGLGGNKFRPSQANRDGSVVPPYLQLTLSNGLVVERKGKNSDLKVIDPNGQKAGQQLLDSFVEQLAIDLPKFMNSTSKEKANILLRIIGVGDKLHDLETKEQELYNQRRTIGQIATQKAKFAKEQTYYPDAPKELVSASELIEQQQAILAKNGENQRKRQQLAQIKSQYEAKGQEIERIKQQLQEAEAAYAALGNDLEIAQKDALDLVDESTEELQANIQQIDEINRKVRANLDKDKAETDAADYRAQYDKLSASIEDVRKEKSELLGNADLPLPGLSVEDGDLIYNGQKWDNMSGADQLRVSTAIVRKLKPDCGFILLDKLEQMDNETLTEFGEWLEGEGLQAIATRVGTGEECSIIIEDGYVVGQSIVEQAQEIKQPQAKTWKAGEF